MHQDKNVDLEIEFLLSCLFDSSPETSRQNLLIRLITIIPFGVNPVKYFDTFDHAETRFLLRERYGRLLSDLKLRRDWKTLLNEEEFHFEKAVYLVSRLGDQAHIHYKTFASQLDDLASGIRDRMQSASSIVEKIEILRNYLFHELHFSGNTEDYYDPDNTYLTCVLETKKGIPVSLGVLMMLVAERCGIVLHGVNLLGHFILRLDTENDPLYIDAFNEGNFLSEEECIQILIKQGISFSPFHLARAAGLDIILRMIRNLLQYAAASGDRKMEKMLQAHLNILENKSNTKRINEEH